MVTASVNVLNNRGTPIQARTLIDTCATTNFITEKLADVLNISKKVCQIEIGALNTLSTISKGIITATIQSRVNNYERTLTFLIVPNILSTVPDQPINKNVIKIPKNIKLADPQFHRPAPVDMLIGAGTALSLLSVGQINLSLKNEPDLILQKTRLGWVIGGSAPTTNFMASQKCCTTTIDDLDLSKFWDIPDNADNTHMSNEEKQCKEFFFSTTRRNDNGRVVVALPFNDKKSMLGESRSIALKRLLGTEKRLSRDPELKKQYEDVIQEYIDLDHMEEVMADESAPQGYYMPHHAVIKSTSLTTKLRVVFDGSCKTDSGISLNDTLMTGPTVQPDMIITLIRFRLHNIVLTGDIEKMYRQFLIRSQDRKYQKILWRDPHGKIKTYQMKTITFGLSASPYLATECLNKLAEDEKHNYPKAAHIIQRDFYVDDLLTGASTKEEVITIRKQITHLLSTGGLTIRQWASNIPEILENLPKDSINKQLQLGDSFTLKTLGVYWDSSKDNINYAIEDNTSTHKITKRMILAETAKIFDPLGLLAPIIIKAKLLMQQLWTLNLHWDESLPLNTQSEWQQYRQQLKGVNELKFERQAIISESSIIQIHGFCDASQKAYGACIYLRSINNKGEIHTRLLCAKSRVAPLKTTTIPRLELCGAVLLTNLLMTVNKAIHLKIDAIYLWTDSTIVLHWINTPVSRLKPFIANRIAEIQTKTSPKEWNHVRSADNPADLISRGISVQELKFNDMWKSGPQWLANEQLPENDIPHLHLLPELKRTVCLVTNTINCCELLTKYSSLLKLQRIMAYCKRFLSSTKPNQSKGALTVTDLHESLQWILKLVQRETFTEEISDLTKGENVNSKSKLLKLRPFIDHEGILRVGGRLKNSTMKYSEKHPIILPKNHHVTTLIIQHEHKINLHSGISTTLYALRRQYWPIDGRNQVAKIIRSCVHCFKTNPKTSEYIMGDLPAARVTESRPFSHVGVDYCGPFLLKERKYRNRNKIKVYIAIFICMAVKAIHIEVVSDLTSDGFIAALKRFMARRGYCSNIYSDNGTNFVGANNEMKQLHTQLHDNENNNKIRQFLATKNIKWHFMPPKSPNFGGLWEAAVKAFKRHIKRVAGIELLFTFEEFNTLSIEIEAILNSRPLTPISSDPNDMLALTPGHFLIGDSLTSLPEHDYSSIPNNRLSSWQLIQKIRRDFWARWHREYLNHLTVRHKWNKGFPNIEIDTLVLIKEDNLPPLHWAMGRVIDVHPGTDGIVRAVSIKLANSTIKRSVTKLAPLPVEEGTTTTIK